MNKRWIDSLRPYEGVIRFVVALLCANYLWKWTVIGEETGVGGIYWFGMELTGVFDLFTDHVAAAVYGLLQLAGRSVHLIDGHILRFAETSNGITIVWSCTGLKQAFIWLVIMVCARGAWKHKLWYVPLGWLCVYLFNILRIFLITLAIEHHPEWFDLLHGYVMKYLFYGMLFMLWVIWDARAARTAETASAA